MARTQTLFYTTSPHEDSFLGRQGAFCSEKCVGGIHPVLTIIGGEKVVYYWVCCGVYFSPELFLFLHPLSLVFCCYCSFSHLIAVPSDLLFSEPVIFTFCGSSWRGVGGAAWGFSGIAELENTIHKPWHHNRRKNSRSWRLWIHTTSWSMCYLPDGPPCFFLLLRCQILLFSVRDVLEINIYCT